MIKRLKVLSVCIVLCMGFVSHSQALTRSDLRTQIRQQVKDTSSSRQRYSDTILNNYINEVQRDFVNRTWSIERSTGFDLAVNTTYYDLPINMIAIKFLYFTNQSGQVTMLDESMERSLRQSNPDWESEGGNAPTDYLVRTSTTGSAEIEIGIFPIPTVVSSTGTINMTYFSQVANLSSDNSIPFEGYNVLVPYHDSIIYGVAAKIMLIENNTNMANSMLSIYNDLIGISSNRLGRAPNYVPSFSAGPSNRLRGSGR